MKQTSDSEKVGKHPVPRNAANMRVTLVIPKRVPHVSQDAVSEFEKAILAADEVRTARTRFPFFARIVWKLLRYTPLAAPLRYLASTNKRHFIVLMATEFVSCLPWFLSSRNNAVYLFDAWPGAHERILDGARLLNIRTVFCSSLQSVEILSAKPAVPCRFIWIPEGIDVSQYRTRKTGDRDIDVIQIGRKHQAYHAAILERLRAAGKTYLFEQTSGQIIFPTREGFIEGLSRAKISICIPSNLTHPERSGNISTMTLRYLQSMASGCLIVGVRPYDMQFLFDYNPVVEIDFNDPAGQLLQILERIESFSELIEQNYRTVREHHTWSRRWEEIRGKLTEVGGERPVRMDSPPLGAKNR